MWASRKVSTRSFVAWLTITSGWWCNAYVYCCFLIGLQRAVSRKCTLPLMLSSAEILWNKWRKRRHFKALELSGEIFSPFFCKYKSIFLLFRQFILFKRKSLICYEDILHKYTRRYIAISVISRHTRQSLALTAIATSAWPARETTWNLLFYLNRYNVG